MLPLLAARWVIQALYQTCIHVLIIDATHDNEILFSAK